MATKRPPVQDIVEARATISVIATMTVAIDPELVTTLINDCGHFHAVEPMIDPTAYRSNMEQVQKNESVFRAFAVFQAACLKANGGT